MKRYIIIVNNNGYEKTIMLSDLHKAYCIAKELKEENDDVKLYDSLIQEYVNV